MRSRLPLTGARCALKMDTLNRTTLTSTSKLATRSTRECCKVLLTSNAVSSYCQMALCSVFRPDFGEKALAMEKAAVAAGVGGQLKYACPWQCLESLQTIASSGVGSLGPRVVFDLHTSTAGVDTETGVMAGTLLDSPHAGTYGLSTAIAKLKAAGLAASRVGWWETNTGRLHDMSHAIMEALDRNELDRHAGAYHLDTRTASFCTEYSGHDDLWTIEAGDQGLVFFSANQTWGQPPAHLHAAMAASAQPHALAVTNDFNSTVDAVAAASEDGRKVTVRIVNPSPKMIDSAVAFEVRLCSESRSSVSLHDSYSPFTFARVRTRAGRMA